METNKGGRPRLEPERKRKKIMITLLPAEIEALTELSLIHRRARGVVAGELFVRELERESKKKRRRS